VERNEPDEEQLLRSVVLQNANSILLARQRAEEDLVRAKDALEARTAELEHALHDLQFQNELNLAIAENATSCLFMMDLNGIATYMNPAAKTVTGYELAELASAPFHDVLHHDRPDGRIYPAAECPINIARERLLPLRNHREVFKRKDGTHFPVACSVSPLLRNGRPAGAILEFRDITDEVRAQKALEDDIRRKDEFLATLSHELRTPMTAVLGWARMLKLGLTESEAHEAIDAIEKSAGVQAQLIDDVLDVSRIMAGKLTFQPKPVDLGSILQAAMTTVHPAASAKSIEILSSIPPLLPVVAGDEGRLQQVLWNLLSNAVKFTPRGGTITVRLSHLGSILRLIVEDTGKGIDPEFLPHVFEPFRQQDSSTTRSHEGIGLGLSIVRSLVELHGGRIRVASEGPGRGATFTVELPVTESARTVSGRARSASSAAAAASLPELPSLSGLKVLVVDDQQFTRDVVTAIFRRAGARVDTAKSVREGVVCFRAEPPDVVVCDVAMPIEDGFAFVREIRALPPPLKNTPIIALTAFGRPEDRQHALAAGFDAYIKKPVDPGELVSTVLSLSASQR